MKTRIRKTVAVVTVVVALMVSVPANAEPVTRTAPYSAGQICYTHINPTNSMYYGSFCHYDPPPYGYNPLNSYGDYGAPFNAIAASARAGQLVVGGYDYLYLPPVASYLANVSKAASIVEFNGSSVAGTVTAASEISGINVSSPYVNRFQVCLELYDMGPIGGMYNSPVRLARDCFNKTSQFRNLSVTAPDVQANRKLKIEVFLNNAAENGGARATVSNISYTLP